MYAPTTIAAKEIITFLWDLFIIVKMINPNNSVPYGLGLPMTAYMA